VKPPLSPLSSLSSVLVLAGVTWTRLVRGRALVVSLFVAMLPCLYALLMRGADGHDVGDELFGFEILVLAILAPMFVASSLGEEIEDRTTTYLWSRPIPRWAILAGKLATLVPLVIAIGCASWFLASQIAWSRVPPFQTFLAIALGAKAIALLATMLATLAPKHGMALTICYLLFFDIPMGLLPATVQEASITHQLRTLSGLWPVDGTFVTGLIGIVAIAFVTFAIAVWRIRRLEA
jgi:ABC-2 type transport system permease protein